MLSLKQNEDFKRLVFDLKSKKFEKARKNELKGRMLMACEEKKDVQSIK